MIPTNNQLTTETSPYLLQHANNPVHWQIWSAQTLELAKKLDKPILLSIGYSACHWCHVMAHESFEDKATAELMNEFFINIKIDREERPDIDQIYQTAYQLMNGQGGGWPLTAFLSPQNQLPFFIGTYFPKTNQYGRPSFQEVLKKINDFYHEHKNQVKEINTNVQNAFSKINVPNTTTQDFNSAELNEKAITELLDNFDQADGGFGSAPKFPMPFYLEQLLTYSISNDGEKAKKAQAALKYTLEKMANSGLFDHIGGGFFRYATDKQWSIPHFEKMLYDNAALLGVYCKTYMLTKNKLFKHTALETINWLSQEMQDPNKGFYSALDADSEGQEGKFYIWQKEEIETLLGPEQFNIISKYFNLDEPPNFEDQWHFIKKPASEKFTNEFNFSAQEIDDHIANTKQILYQHRQQRYQLNLDNKILCSWNGLIIKNLAIAGITLNQNKFIEKAQNIIDFIRTSMWVNNQLHTTYQNNQPKYHAYLDDYVNLIDGIFYVLQASWREIDAEFILHLTSSLIENFHDSNEGGFFFTAHEHEKLIHRDKPFMDTVTPSGNGVAALALNRLGHLFARQDLLELAQTTIQAGSGFLQNNPSSFYHVLLALSEIDRPPLQILVYGAEHELETWKITLQDTLSLNHFLFTIADSCTTIPPQLQQLKYKNLNKKNKVTAIICHGHQCLEPCDNLIEANKIIAQIKMENFND